MCNKPYHQPAFFIKILLTFIVLAALYIPNIAYSQLCDRDGVCESGETADNCVFDCKISTLDKDIKIFLYALGVRKVIHFGSHYTDKTETTNLDEVLNLIKSNADFSVDGRVEGNRYIYNEGSSIPVVYYIVGTSLPTGISNYPSAPQYEYYQLANNHEEWFLHEDGADITPQNRLLESYWFSAIYDLGSLNWRNTFTDYAAKYLDSGQVGIGDDNRAGIYYDAISDYFRESFCMVNKIETRVAVKEYLDGVDQIKYVNTQKNIFPYVNKITVTDSNNPDISYVATPWPGFNVVFLDSIVPTGTLVDINYYYQAERPLRMTDEYYKNSTLDMLKQTRTKIGNGKLLIVNGYQGLHDYAGDGFLNPIDGAMREGFISRAESFSESQWISVIDQLKDISDTRKKIELVQAVNKDNLSDADAWDDAMYQFTSFLLGKGPWAYFNYTYGFGSWYQKFVYFDFYKTDIGSPYEDYHLRGNIDGANIYEREFEKVLVLVNPGDISANISLNKTFYTLMGNLVGSITLEPKSGIMLLKYSAGVTTTTTSVQPATTTTATSGGGGGGGGESTTSITTTSAPGATSTSTISATSSVPKSTTTTLLQGECLNNADCDDGKLCNGTEVCTAGKCVPGTPPCAEGQVCRELTGSYQCWTALTITGQNIPQTISRSIVFDKQQRWILVMSTEDDHFSSSSSITIAGPDANAHGVMFDPTRKPFKLKRLFAKGSFIFIPVVIDKLASTGTWTVNIITKEPLAAQPMEETIMSAFQLT